MDELQISEIHIDDGLWRVALVSGGDYRYDATI